jgi:hypothetical protein
MKEEQQTRVMTEFEVEEKRTMVEGDRGVFWFISIVLVALNRP